jgi:hypothetical protein
VGWVWLNYSTGWELYSVNVAAKQAGIIVVTGIAFRLLAAGKKTYSPERTSSGSLAIFAPIRRASSFVGNFAAELR